MMSPMEKDTNSQIFIDEYVDYCTENIFDLFPKEKDAQVADAILEYLEKEKCWIYLIKKHFIF
jgi:hypothetical protein